VTSPYHRLSPQSLDPAANTIEKSLRRRRLEASFEPVQNLGVEASSVPLGRPRDLVTKLDRHAQQIAIAVAQLRVDNTIEK
jgi:hypothetical protein